MFETGDGLQRRRCVQEDDHRGDEAMRSVHVQESQSESVVHPG